jgi:hypothetical protein
VPAALLAKPYGQRYGVPGGYKAVRADGSPFPPRPVTDPDRGLDWDEVIDRYPEVYELKPTQRSPPWHPTTIDGLPLNRPGRVAYRA